MMPETPEICQIETFTYLDTKYKYRTGKYKTEKNVEKLISKITSLESVTVTTGFLLSVRDDKHENCRHLTS